MRGGRERAAERAERVAGAVCTCGPKCAGEGGRGECGEEEGAGDGGGEWGWGLGCAACEGGGGGGGWDVRSCEWGVYEGVRADEVVGGDAKGSGREVRERVGDGG